MGGTLAGTAARVASGIGIVACAAVIAFAAGGGNVLGGLGGIFGRDGSSLQVAKAGSAESAAGIVVEPAARARRKTVAERVAPTHARIGQPQPQQRRPAHPYNPVPVSSPAPQRPPSPAPAPVPQVPPTAPAPSPGAGPQVVTTVGQTVKQVTGQLPSQLQPLTQPVDQVVDTLVKTCGSLPVCP